MSNTAFDFNRVFHMARRDAHFERAMDLLNAPIEQLDADARLAHITRELELLKTAELHARFVIKASTATQEGKDFVHFLELMRDSAQSAQAMVQHECHFECEKSFLSQFLGANPGESTLHYRRRADDIISGLWQLLRLAHRPYRAIQQAALDERTEAENERYERAYSSALTELDAQKEPPVSGS